MRGRRPALLAILVAMVFALAGAPLIAQQTPNLAKGFAADQVYQFGNLDHINLFNGNLNVGIPVGQNYRVGGAVSYALVLSYAGNNWDYNPRVVPTCGGPDHICTETTVMNAVPVDFTNAGLGWVLGFGSLKYAPIPPATDAPILRTADGAAHNFVSQLHYGEPIVAGVWYTVDGTYLRATRIGVFAGGTTKYYYDIESPDGTIDRYSEATLLFDSRRDHFGNHVDATYAVNGDGSPLWTITDTQSRVHTISFKRLAVPSMSNGGDPAYFDVVKTVTLAAFNGRSLIYTFNYDGAAAGTDAVTQISRQRVVPQDSDFNAAVKVPLLAGVTVTDGGTTFATWAMTTDIGDGGATFSDPVNGDETLRTFSGHLRSLRLPTLGTIFWDYQPYKFPSDTVEKFRNVYSRSAGVKQRRQTDAAGTVLTKTNYGTNLVDLSIQNPPSPPTYVAPRSLINTVTLVDPKNADATVSRTVSYFSVANYQATAPGIAAEYALPLTRDTNPENTGTSDVTNPDGAFALSSKTYDAAGKLQRVEYVQYEQDDTDTVYWEGMRNRRLLATKTVFYNDAGVAVNYATTTYSDFDGLGHYRTTTTGGDFPGINVRTTTTAYNRPDGNVGGTVFDSGTYTPPAPNTMASGYNPPATSVPWILNTFTSQRTAEGTSSERTLSCFEYGTGFLQRRRVVVDANALSSNDVLSRITNDGLGNAGREESFGGDAPPTGTNPQALAAAPLCTMNLPAAAQYRIDHTWQRGSLATSTYVNAATNTAMPFLAVDQTIDRNTGLASIVRDSAGLATAFDYDAAGRLILSTPPGGERATTYAFTPASPGTPASVRISRIASGDGPEAEIRFDDLGRPVLGLRKQADSGWASQQTLYDGAGRKWKSSAWETTPSHFTVLTYDSLGRAKNITAPDSHATLLDYTGNSSMTRKLATRTSALGESYALTTESYDRFGRLRTVLEQSKPGGVTTTYSYDVAGRLRSADAVDGTQTRTFTYDGRGFLSGETSPEKTAGVQYWHDARGHVTRSIDGPFDLRFTYDAAERLTAVRSGSTDLKTFTYGTANDTDSFVQGKLLTATRRQNDTVLGGDVTVTETYRYNGVGGRVSQRTTDVSSTASFSGASFNTTLTYDDLGMTSATPSAPRRPPARMLPRHGT